MPEIDFNNESVTMQCEGHEPITVGLEGEIVMIEQAGRRVCMYREEAIRLAEHVNDAAAHLPPNDEEE